MPFITLFSLKRQNDRRAEKENNANNNHKKKRWSVGDNSWSIHKVEGKVSSGHYYMAKLLPSGIIERF